MAAPIACSAPTADTPESTTPAAAPQEAPQRAQPSGIALTPRRHLVPERQDVYRVISRGTAIPDDLVWSSSDSSVASVRALDGARALVTGLREGRTVIAAYSRSDPTYRAEHDLWIGPPIPFPPIPPRDTTMGSLRVRAESSLGSDTSEGVAGAQLLRASVTIANDGSPQTLRHGGCGLWLTGHMGGRHWDQEVHVHPPMWDQRRLGCGADAPESLTLGAGDTLHLETRVYAHEVLGDSLDARDYHLHAHVPIAGDTLVLYAGAQALRFGIEQLSARARTWIVEGIEMDTLRGRATLVNELDVPVRVEYGACALRLRAYRTPAHSGEPVWRSELRAPWRGTFGYACPAYLAIGHIDAGGELSPKEFDVRIPVIEVLGDSLPNGRYYFTAALKAAGDTFRVPAGDVALNLEREPLPDVRVRDGVTYRAEMEIVGTDPVTVRALTTFARDPRGSSLRHISVDCPVVLHAYRSRERRDAAPRSGPADWRKPRSCGAGEREIVLRGATPHTFEVSATAQEIVGDSLPPGRYYFAVSVNTGGPAVFLSAGEAELRR